MSIKGTSQVVGVFGYPVRHSASPPMHNAAFTELEMDWVYVPFGVAPENIEQAVHGIRAMGIRGMNVTVPLKELIPPLMDEMTPRAKALGAVNTIINRDGRLIGDSTDGPGFLAAIAHAGVKIGPGTKVVLLGAGGSARAVAYALADIGASVLVANRSFERAAAIARDFADIGDITPLALDSPKLSDAIGSASLLVNTTSIGMHPNENDIPPLAETSFHAELFVSDLIYNPRETKLLALARSRGCKTQNGIEMLVRQGALSFAHWTGIEPPISTMRDAVLGAMGGR